MASDPTSYDPDTYLITNEWEKDLKQIKKNFEVIREKFKSTEDPAIIPPAPAVATPANFQWWADISTNKVINLRSESNTYWHGLLGFKSSQVDPSGRVEVYLSDNQRKPTIVKDQDVSPNNILCISIRDKELPELWFIDTGGNARFASLDITGKITTPELVVEYIHNAAYQWYIQGAGTYLLGDGTLTSINSLSGNWRIEAYGKAYFTDGFFSGRVVSDQGVYTPLLNTYPTSTWYVTTAGLAKFVDIHATGIISADATPISIQALGQIICVGLDAGAALIKGGTLEVAGLADLGLLHTTSINASFPTEKWAVDDLGNYRGHTLILDDEIICKSISGYLPSPATPYWKIHSTGAAAFVDVYTGRINTLSDGWSINPVPVLPDPNMDNAIYCGSIYDSKAYKFWYITYNGETKLSTLSIISISATGMVSCVGLNAGTGYIRGASLDVVGLAKSGSVDTGAIDCTGITSTGLISCVGLAAGSAPITGATTITASGLASCVGLAAGGGAISDASTITASGLLSCVGVNAGGGSIINVFILSASGLVSCVGLDVGGSTIVGATTITATGKITCVGLDAGGAPIEGATTITATGLVTCVGINIGGAPLSGATTITATGKLTCVGIDVGNSAIEGATTITATGKLTCVGLSAGDAAIDHISTITASGNIACGSATVSGHTSSGTLTVTGLLTAGSLSVGSLTISSINSAANPWRIESLGDYYGRNLTLTGTFSVNDLHVSSINTSADTWWTTSSGHYYGTGSTISGTAAVGALSCAGSITSVYVNATQVNCSGYMQAGMLRLGGGLLNYSVDVWYVEGSTGIGYFKGLAHHDPAPLWSISTGGVGHFYGLNFSGDNWYMSPAGDLVCSTVTTSSGGASIMNVTPQFYAPYPYRGDKDTYAWESYVNDASPPAPDDRMQAQIFVKKGANLSGKLYVDQLASVGSHQVSVRFIITTLGATPSSYYSTTSAWVSVLTSPIWTEEAAITLSSLTTDQWVQIEWIYRLNGGKHNVWACAIRAW